MVKEKKIIPKIIQIIAIILSNTVNPTMSPYPTVDNVVIAQ